MDMGALFGGPPPGVPPLSPALPPPPPPAPSSIPPVYKPNAITNRQIAGGKRATDRSPLGSPDTYNLLRSPIRDLPSGPSTPQSLPPPRTEQMSSGASVEGSGCDGAISDGASVPTPVSSPPGALAAELRGSHNKKQLRFLHLKLNNL